MALKTTSPLLSDGVDKYRPRTVLILCLLFLLNVVLGVLIPILSESNALYSVELVYDYQPGELANEDVVAPYDFSFDDEIATRQLRERRAAAVLPQFDFSYAESVRSLALTRALVQALESGDEERILAALPSDGIDRTSFLEVWNALDAEERTTLSLILDDSVLALMQTGLFSSTELAQISQEGYTSADAELPDEAVSSLARRIVDTASLVGEDGIVDWLIDYLKDYDIKMSARGFDLLSRLVASLVEPNVRYNALTTEDLRREARESTPTVQAEIHRGDYILRYDTIVTEQALQTIRMINGISVDVSPLQLIGRFIFLAVILYVALYFISSFIERKYRVLVYTYIFLITLAIVLILSYLVTFFFQQQSQMVDQIIPFLFLPLLMSQLTSRKRMGFVAGAVYSCFILFFPTTGAMTFFYLVFSIEVSLLFMRFSVTRLDMIYQGFYTALANIFITVVFHFILDKPLAILFQEVIAVTMNVALSYILIGLLLPLLEHFLNIPTVFRLHELSSTDSPVLVRLRTQAIGTYNHSVNVSDMAYNAAKEIGANAELAKVGGLYHDIGKSDHPEYFIENQGGGPNVHDEMKYTLSAAVIKSHVKLGVEKGKEVGLPQEVLDIIEQHHGNDIISFFYNKAMEEAKASRTPIQVNEEDFRYNAEIPQTREAGIVMLADCFEAASRTLKKPTTLRYEKLFTSILVGKMNGNQLDDCMLSMAEIEKIKRVFVHQAFGRDHMRIQYTKEGGE